MKYEGGKKMERRGKSIFALLDLNRKWVLLKKRKRKKELSEEKRVSIIRVIQVIEKLKVL